MLARALLICQRRLPKGQRHIYHKCVSVSVVRKFERDLIRERTHAGLKAARARGRLGGRPKSLDPQKAALARKLYDERVHTVKEIANMVGISKPGLYHYLKGRHKKQPETLAVGGPALG